MIIRFLEIMAFPVAAAIGAYVLFWWVALAIYIGDKLEKRNAKLE